MLLFLLCGPGVIVMLAENDGPSMLSYATTGATYGIGFFLPFILVTFLMAYVVQEMALRIGVTTQRGHAELIQQRFGSFWGGFALIDLVVVNFLTIVTEFAAVRAGAAYFGIPGWLAIGAAFAVVGGALTFGRYFTWERIVLVFASANLLFVPAAFLAHPSGAAIAYAFQHWGPIAGGATPVFWTLVVANVGATVTPWMIFFQQSASIDKGLQRNDLPQGRADTAIGAIVAAAVAIATVIAASVLFTHRINVASLASGADFARALHPFIGSVGATLFALAMIEAGLVAAMTISISSSYALGEVLHCGRTLNRTIAEEPIFYLCALGATALAGAAVLIPNAPLIAITITVNVIAMLLMAPALLFVLLLANDREIMGRHANGVFANLAGGGVIITICLLGGIYGFVNVLQLVLHG
jgi:Mn2+/Fe2+ NRAMP family transporter